MLIKNNNLKNTTLSIGNTLILSTPYIQVTVNFEFSYLTHTNAKCILKELINGKKTTQQEVD